MCGLAIGWRLASAGARVTVFDRSDAGRGASWAAAGMLAAGIECEPGEEHLLRLNLASQALWPAFARELETLTGHDIGYRDEGTLVAALTRDDVEQLRFSYEFQTALGVDLQWLSGADARRREPHLRPGVPAAVFSPNDHQVDNRRLVKALAAALTQAGGLLRENTRITRIDVQSARVLGVVSGEQRYDADVVVLAAGAWSRDIEGLPPTARPPVRPVKGQMLALRTDPANPVLEHVLWAPRVYLVPRRDGRIVIGGTVEERGFDEDLTAGGIFSILEAAWRAFPNIEDLPIDEFWVGFRPTSRDDAPILGPTDVEGLFLATGHHRNGILSTPITAEAVAAAILGRQVPAATAGFGVQRFAEHTTGASSETA